MDQPLIELGTIFSVSDTRIGTKSHSQKALRQHLHCSPPTPSIISWLFLTGSSYPWQVRQHIWAENRLLGISNVSISLEPFLYFPDERLLIDYTDDLTQAHYLRALQFSMVPANRKPIREVLYNDKTGIDSHPSSHPSNHQWIVYYSEYSHYSWVLSLYSVNILSFGDKYFSVVCYRCAEGYLPKDICQRIFCLRPGIFE